MMSDDMLSQDEIDALLRGSDDEEEEEVNNGSPLVNDYLTSIEQDALGEIGNISFGSSATALSTLLNQKVEITTPAVSVIQKNRLGDEFPSPYVAIEVSYTAGFSGSNLLVIRKSDAAIIADLMLGGDGLSPSEMLGEIQLSAVQEAMNQMMGSSATSMSTIFGKRVDISPPSIDLLNVNEGEGTERIPNEEIIVKVSFRLKIGKLIDSSIMQLLPIQFAKGLVNELMNPTETSEGPLNNGNSDALKQDNSSFNNQSANQVNQQFSQKHVEQTANNKIGSQPEHTNNSSYSMPNYSGTPQHIGSSSQFQEGQHANVQPAAFSNFESVNLPESESKNLNMLLDIPLQVTVELGRTKRSVKEILELSSGSIIELDKLAGEPVDILVNNKLIAKGEVVVIDENFGVRITDIISQTDRIKKLR